MTAYTETKKKRLHLDAHAERLLEFPPEAGLPDDTLLTTRQEASWLQTSEQWLEIGRSQGYGPPFVRLGPNTVRYRVGDTKRWLASRVRVRASDDTPPSGKRRGRPRKVLRAEA